MLDTKALGAIVSGIDLDCMEFPPLHWIVTRLIAEGLTLLVAPPKIGKSWFVLALALSRANGTTFLGLPVSQGPVLYLALEDGWRRLKDRSRRLLGDEPFPRGIDFVITLDPEKQALATIQEWMIQHKGRNPLIIVDTLGKVKPAARAGASAYEHDYAVLGQLKSLVDRDPGSAMILVHHDRKATSDDFMDSVSGTNGIAGAADTTIVIRRARTEGDATISVTGRDVYENEYAASFGDGRWALVGGSLATAQQEVTTGKATVNLGDTAARIVAAVGKAPGTSTIAEVAETSGLSAATVKDYLSRLERSGRLFKAGRGRYYQHPSQVSQVSPWTEDPNESDTSDGCDTALCDRCNYRLDPIFTAAGETHHAACAA